MADDDERPALPPSGHTHGKPEEGLECLATMEDITVEDGNYPEHFQVQVAVRPGRTRLFTVTAATTGEALAARVRADTGLTDFYLLQGGHPIREAAALGALGVGADSTIEVKVRGRAGMGCGASKVARAPWKDLSAFPVLAAAAKGKQRGWSLPPLTAEKAAWERRGS